MTNGKPFTPESITFTNFEKVYWGRIAGSHNWCRFDWEKAARIIMEQRKMQPDLVAEAGLQGDWSACSCVVYAHGAPIPLEEVYCHQWGSTWAEPTLVIGDVAYPCWIHDEQPDTYWTPEAIAILQEGHDEG